MVPREHSKNALLLINYNLLKGEGGLSSYREAHTIVILSTPDRRLKTFADVGYGIDDRQTQKAVKK